MLRWTADEPTSDGEKLKSLAKCLTVGVLVSVWGRGGLDRVLIRCTVI